MLGIRQSVSLRVPALVDTIRRGFSRIPYGERQADRYVKGLRARIADGRCKCAEQIAAIVIDIAQRGELADAKAIGDALNAIAQDEHARIHGAQIVGVIDAWQRETATEGEKNRAEIAAVLNPNATTLAALEDAKRRYDVVDEVLLTAVRNKVLQLQVAR